MLAHLNQGRGLIDPWHCHGSSALVDDNGLRIGLENGGYELVRAARQAVRQV